MTCCCVASPPAKWIGFSTKWQVKLTLYSSVKLQVIRNAQNCTCKRNVTPNAHPTLTVSVSTHCCYRSNTAHIGNKHTQRKCKGSVKKRLQWSSNIQGRCRHWKGVILTFQLSLCLNTQQHTTSTFHPAHGLLILAWSAQLVNSRTRYDATVVVNKRVRDFHSCYRLKCICFLVYRNVSSLIHS